MKKNFNEWLETFKESIADYKYYISFENVYGNTEEYKNELDLLNNLVGSKNIENEFVKLIEEHPNAIKAIPILLAIREKKIYCQKNLNGINYDFDNFVCSKEQYCYFMKETGLFDLLSNRITNNLYDYVLGVNAGLDSNARKNRGGHLMEDLVESFLVKANVEYSKEMWSDEIEDKCGLNLSVITNNGEAHKRFDFVVKGKNTVYGIECNFYSSGGSKLNETARSYKMIAEESKTIDSWKFIWITDGKGWNSARNNLKETFDILVDLYNINDLENNVLEDILK